MESSWLVWMVLWVPLFSGAACLALRSPRLILAAVCTGVLASTVLVLGIAWGVRTSGPLEAAQSWLFIDSLSAYHLVIMALVFLLSSFYAWVYFREEIGEGHLTDDLARRFALLWFGALAAMTLVLVSNNIGILWVGMEATTLVTAFLICIHRTPASLEAMWKYVIICSVGIAFAFMGTLFVGAAADRLNLPASQALLWTTLSRQAAGLDPKLIKLAFLFLLVGYGTKVGLAPMHSWLPDAHSQSPAPVSALFSGFMLNAALYCIMRYVPLVEGATGHGHWAMRLLLTFGILSVLLAGAFIVFQRDLKRLFAYSSVEHLGIIAIGLGLGGLGTFAALLHALNHSLGKSLAFFSAGRIGQVYGTYDMRRISGGLRAAPVWGKGLLGSLLTLVGAAPFAIFMSEFLIVRAAVEQKAFWTLGLFLLGAGIVFVGALRHLTGVVWGLPASTARQEDAGLLDRAIVGILLVVLVVLGLWIPDLLVQGLEQAAAIIEGKP